jgi:hypothetical protein
MKVFVGTMEHGESDFSMCKESIKMQSGVEITHHIVSNLPEKEAHESLFTAWNEAKTTHDLFLKVDADTVLFHNEVIRNYISIFEKNERVTGVQAWLHDYMTDRYIFGLTCLRNTVNVATQVNKLYPDRADTGHDIVLRGNDLPKELIPAGKHCWYSSETQAFRYGFHRGKKKQKDILTSVFSAWEKNGFDDLRGLCLMGFKLSSLYNNVDYSDAEFREAFDTAKKTYSIKEVIK